MSIQEKIKAKEEQILKKRENIKVLINAVDIPYEELVKMIKELKN